MGFGDYPAEYNPAKHGPYDPSRFYGKRKYQFKQNSAGNIPANTFPT